MMQPSNFAILEDKVLAKSAVISVLGLGRIGLPTAVEFASHGFRVIGVDINASLLDDLKKNKTFVDEPRLEELLVACNEKKMIEYSNDTVHAIQNSDFIIICMPTPINEDMGPDYSIIKQVSATIGKNLRKNQVIIVESSVSPTTIERLMLPIIQGESKLVLNQDFGICSCPERADPGKIVDNFDKVPRIIGGSSAEVTGLVTKLYASITKAKIVQVSTPGTANAIKLTENIFRDVNIALINELAVLYELLGIDIKEVIAGCSTKYNFQPHYPGPGVGGPCLPANPYYIFKDAARVNYIPFLIRVAREVNDRMPEHVKDLVLKALNMAGIPINGTTVTVLGVSYKANVRDIQISPAIRVINLLKQLNAKLKIYDPFFKGEQINGWQGCNSLEEAVSGTSAIIILTDHDEFKRIDFKMLYERVTRMIIIDSRNIYDANTFPEGTIYCGIGRPLRKIPELKES
ncbi:MAG: nucleotide sugar dehydrogenase [Candidatus Sigynarchaeota archaeon]